MSAIETGVNVPQECSSGQLFKDAAEVVKLSTDLAGLEDQFDRKFFEYYVNAPVGTSDKGREMYALNCIKEQHSDLWVEIDTTRARMRGLTLKASIVNSASRVLTIENNLHPPH